MYFKLIVLSKAYDSVDDKNSWLLNVSFVWLFVFVIWLSRRGLVKCVMEIISSQFCCWTDHGSFAWSSRSWWWAATPPGTWAAAGESAGDSLSPPSLLHPSPPVSPEIKTWVSLWQTKQNILQPSLPSPGLPPRPLSAWEVCFSLPEFCETSRSCRLWWELGDSWPGHQRWHTYFPPAEIKQVRLGWGVWSCRTLPSPVRGKMSP